MNNFTLTPEEFEHCRRIYEEADSVYDAIDDILECLGYNPDTHTMEDRCAILTAFSKQLNDALKGSDESSEAATICSCCNNSLSPNVQRMYELCNNVADTYARKNADYGDSFHTSVQKYGLISALTRMSDKWNRLENLILHGGKGKVDEAVTDTLVDLAAYALMTVMELE